MPVLRMRVPGPPLPRSHDLSPRVPYEKSRPPPIAGAQRDPARQRDVDLAEQAAEARRPADDLERDRGDEVGAVEAAAAEHGGDRRAVGGVRLQHRPEAQAGREVVARVRGEREQPPRARRC